mmetsp:Transcript_10574/g.42687  ORF Transcript_10574/g.42687 Transcript_10574/m.42687 type:complete len:232 (-) Transcript_10574:4592-5287(-)
MRYLLWTAMRGNPRSAASVTTARLAAMVAQNRVILGGTAPRTLMTLLLWNPVSSTQAVHAASTAQTQTNQTDTPVRLPTTEIRVTRAISACPTVTQGWTRTALLAKARAVLATNRTRATKGTSHRGILAASCLVPVRPQAITAITAAAAITTAAATTAAAPPETPSGRGVPARQTSLSFWAVDPRPALSTTAPPRRCSSARRARPALPARRSISSSRTSTRWPTSTDTRCG